MKISGEQMKLEKITLSEITEARRTNTTFSLVHGSCLLVCCVKLPVPPGTRKPERTQWGKVLP